MLMNREDKSALKAMEIRLKTVLPEQYQDCYEEVQPISMGSAGLKYGSDGKVAWNDIWGSFCDLAMAGGPPHKGVLLEPASREDIEAQMDRYQQVAKEICRGVSLVTDRVSKPSLLSGWIQVQCESSCMADWLVRAIVMENVSARHKDSALYLPAGPGFRLEKEIKNVITVIAKTWHYWVDHIWLSQQREIEDLFARMAAESPLLVPGFQETVNQSLERQRLAAKITQAIHQSTWLYTSNHNYSGWLGVECGEVRAAIWMMRALVVSNVLSRREGTVLFVPLNAELDSNGEIVVRKFREVHSFARLRNVL